jgi:hypothetical protein
MTSAQMIRELATRDSIDPQTAAELLGLPILSVEQVSAVRREYQLGSNALFVDATAVIGGRDARWRVIDLVPREMMLAPLLALMRDAPYEQRPILKHTDDGPMIVGLEHHLALDGGELVIATRGARIERITLMKEAALDRRSCVLR